MLKTLKTTLVLATLSLFTSGAFAAEFWKGHTEARPLEAGLMSGMAIYGNHSNWSVLASGAYLLKDKAFVADLDDRIWAEVQMGPSFFSTPASTETGLQYSAHLRWDFSYNELWTVYALGGFGGFGLPKSYGSSLTFHPRFGAGVEYQTKTALLFRGEISAEFVGVGVALNF